MGVSKFLAEPIRSIGFAALTAAYQALGTGFTAPISKILVTNTTDANCMFSFDSINDHFVVPAQTQFVLDISMENILDDYLAQGSLLYVKRLAVPAAGTVYFSTFYGKNR